MMEKINVFMQSDNLKTFKHKLFNAKVFILLIVFILIDGLMTFKNYAYEINPLVKQLFTFGIITGTIMKSAIMLGAITSIYLISRNYPIAKKCLNGLLFLGVITILFNSTNVFATYTDSYGEYQDDISNRGFVHDEFGLFNQTMLTYCSIGDGMNYQILSDDFDSDGYKEFVIFSNSAIRVYDYLCNLKFEKIIGTNLASQPSLYDSHSIAFVGLDDVIQIVNLSDMYLDNIYNFTGNNSCAEYSGIKCHNNYCYVMCDINGGTKKTHLWKFDTLSNSYGSLDSIKRIRPLGAPALSPLTTLTTDNLVFSCDTNDNGVFGICVVDTNTLELDTVFNSVGYVDDLTLNYVNGEYGAVTQPLIYNLDGGYNELVVTYGHCTEGTGDTYLSRMNVYTATGGTKSGFPVSTTIRTNVGGTCSASGITISIPSNPVIMQQGSNARLCMVMTGDNSGLSTFRGFKCYDVNGNTVLSNGTVCSGGGCVLTGVNDSTILTAPMVSGQSTSHDNIIWFEGILQNNRSYALRTSYSRNEKISLFDLNNDLSLDIIYTQGGMTTIYGASFVDVIPSLNGRQFGMLPYSMPLCVGTTITFSASECSGENNATCHYYNDNPQQSERLISNCGTNITYFNGTMSMSNPLLDCYYSTTGTRSAVVYLQDSSNKNDLSNSYSYVITVINGTAGEICNLPATPEQINGEIPGLTPTNGEPSGALSQSDIQFVINTLTGGGSTFVKLLLVLGFTIALIAYFAKLGIQNPIIYSVGVFALWIVFALLNFLSWIFVIIFAFVMILTSAIFFVKGNSQGQ